MDSINTVYLNLDFKYILKDNLKPHFFLTTNGLWKKVEGIKQLNHLNNYDIIENLSPVYAKIDTINQTSSGFDTVQISPFQYSDQVVTVVIKGTIEFINYSRMQILKSYNQINFKLISLNKSQFSRITDIFINKLTAISQKCKVEILMDDNLKQIQIIGNQDNITVSEIQVRILVDSLLNDFLIESIDVSLSIIPLIGGVDLFNFNEIAHQSNTNIYIPDLLPHLFNTDVYDKTSFKVWITAEKMIEILNAKKVLNGLIEKLNDDKFIVKPLEVSKDKLGLITMYNQSDLLNIMFELGSFIQIPSLGDSSNVVKIQSNNINSVNETIERLNMLTAKYYKLLINFNNISYNLSNDLHDYLCQLLPNFHCSTKLNKFGLEIVSNNSQMNLILKTLNLSSVVFKVSLLIEIDNDQKDFISGKKNGKILKILNKFPNLKSVIKFLPLNEYNFLVDLIIENPDFKQVIQIIDLLELELPCESKFNIPEIFHKSIIGNGGLIIQSIMKKYNVYIKFSSSKNNFYYSFKRHNNVLVKCPRKNENNISLVKDEINQLVINCCENNLNSNYLSKNINNSIYKSVDFKLLKSHYILLINKFKLNEVNNLEIEFQSFIDWPNSIDEFDDNNHDKMLSIKGSDIKLNFFINQLVDMLPQNYTFKLPKNNNFINLKTCRNARFINEILLPFKIFYNIELSFIESEDQDEIWLSYFDNSHLTFAVDKLTNYLRSENFLILDKHAFKYEPIQEDYKTPTMDYIPKGKNIEKPRGHKTPLTKITNEV